MLIILQLGSLPALIAAAVALGENNSGSAAIGSGAFPTDDSDVVTQSEVNGAAGFVVAITALAILGEVFAIVLRFCNVGLVNIKIKIVLVLVS